MGFPGQEYWSALPFPFPGNLPNPGIEPMSPALQAYFYLYSLSHMGSPQWAGKLVNMEHANKEDWPYLHSKSRKTYKLLRNALALSLSDALLWGECLYISDRFIIWYFKEETNEKKRSASGYLGPEGDTGSFFLPVLLLGPSICWEMSPPHSHLYWYPFRNWYCVCAVSVLVCLYMDYWMREEEGSIFFQAAAVSHLMTTADSSFPEDGIHKKSQLLGLP